MGGVPGHTRVARPGPELILIGIPQPAAGAEFTYEFPGALGECELLLCTFRFQTSATIGTRSVTLTINDPQNKVKGRAESGTGQVASITRAYVFGQTGISYLGVSGDNQHVPLQRAYLRGVDSISSITGTMAVGDQYDRITVWLERFAT